MSTNQQNTANNLTKIVCLVIVICVLVSLVWVVTNHRAEAEKNKKQNDPPEMFIHKGNEIVVPQNSPLISHLKVAAVNSGASTQMMSFPATVEANTALSANIEPPLIGRLVKLNVKLGDHVQKGQVLAVMSSGDLAQAFADVSKAKDSLDLANMSLKRAKEVNDIGANANKDLEAAKSAQIQAKYEYERATSRVRTLGGHVGQPSLEALLPILAPISGSVTTLNVGNGSFINDNTTAIMTISNLDQVFVSANIPEASLGQVQVGQAADVILPAYPDQVLHGQISNIASTLDSDTRRSKARIVFNNAGMKLKPNMFATVQIHKNQNNKIIVPQSALLMNNDSVTVFVEVRPNTYVRKAVQLGSENDDQVEIVSGLNPSDRVIISGGVLLND